MTTTAIAQVTVALKELLKANLNTGVGVSLLQPSDALPKNSVNLYLFRVAENAQLKNTGWRGDRTRDAMAAPALALELYYLLTPFADAPKSTETTLPAAHTLLGSAMQVFFEHPVVNDVHTSAFDFDTLAGIGDLRNSFDKIIVRLQGMAMEELSKVWMMFNQPYRLSVVYQVSLLQIGPTVSAPSRAAPVMVTAVDVTTLGPPGLVDLTPSSGGTGGVVTARGSGFARPGSTTSVLFGGRLLDAAGVTDSQLQITVPADLAAGPEQEVQVLRDDWASSPAAYTVTPWLKRLIPQRGAPGTPSLPVTLEVTGEDLSTAAGIAVTLDGAPLAHTVIDSTHLRIAIPAATPNGLHGVRVTANGRTSNTRQLEVIPLITTLVPATPVVGGPVSINGRRLDGAQVDVRFGPALVSLGASATANQVQVARVPQLDAGRYEVRVIVDGRASNPLPFTVP
jgi:hypothetical protein